jgi:hypothetical protein
VQKRVDKITASMRDIGQQTPILVRADGARFVLVEACTGWKPPGRSARKPSSASAWKRASTERPSGSSGG